MLLVYRVRVRLPLTRLVPIAIAIAIGCMSWSMCAGPLASQLKMLDGDGVGSGIGGDCRHDASLQRTVRGIAVRIRMRATDHLDPRDGDPEHAAGRTLHGGQWPVAGGRRSGGGRMEMMMDEQRGLRTCSVPAAEMD